MAEKMKTVSCISFIRAAVVFIALAAALSASASAYPQIHGFRSSWLTVGKNGVSFNDSNYNMTVGVYANNTLIPTSYFGGDVYYNRVIATDNYYNTSANGSSYGYWVNSTQTIPGYSWNISLKVTQGELNSYQGGSLSFIFNTTSAIIPVGTGTFEVQTGSTPCVNEFSQTVSCSEYDVWSNADLISTAAAYGLVATESYYSQAVNGVNINFYKLSFTNITSYSPVGTYYFDPTISTFSANNFDNGVFNNTYTNDSQSVFTNYFANNHSFSGSGSYFSQAIVLNHTGPSAVGAVNWNWFEAGGIQGANDSPVLDMHFANDTKDSTRYNNTGIAINGPLNYVPAQTGYGIDFNGSKAQEVDTVPSLNTNGEASTVVFWLNYNATLSNLGNLNSNSTTFMDSRSGTGTYFQVYNQSSQYNITYQFDNTGNAACQAYAPFLPAYSGNWIQVAGEYNSSGIQLFINGVNVGESETTSGCSFGNGLMNALQVAGSSQDNTYLNGSIGEVQVWNRTLSATEIQDLYDWESSSAFIHNFTNVTIALRTKSYGFNDSSLVSWWDLGDSSSNESAALESLDLSGNGNTLALMGNSTAGFPVETSGSCVIGNCLALDGYNTYLTTADQPGFEYRGGNFTASLWFKQANNTGTQYLLTKPWNDDGQYDYQVYLASGGVLKGQLFGNRTWTTTNSTAISSNAWHEVVLDLNSTGFMGIYLDGNLVESNTTSGITGNWTSSFGNQAKNLTIGTDYPYGSTGSFVGSFNGSLDDVKIWNRTLSAAEISSLYNNGCPTCSSGEELNWTGWSQPYSGGSFVPYGTSGNILQYLASFSSTSSNYSAFLQNVTISYHQPAPPTSTVVLQPMSVYGYFTGGSPNSIVNVTAYLGGVQAGVFTVTTNGQYGLFDVPGNYTDYGQSLTLEANNSASWASSTTYSPGSTTLVDIPT